MHHGIQLLKEKIVTLSELQRNPSKALDSPIVRIVKNGKELGIYLSREEFEDFVEEFLHLQPPFERKLKKSIASSKKKRLTPLPKLFK